MIGRFGACRIAALLVMLTVLSAGVARAQDPTGPAVDRPALDVGWYLWDPYQFTEQESGYDVLTGLDVELLRIIAQRAGYDVTYWHIPWDVQLVSLREGTLDLATGATRTAERETYAYFTEPYRTESTVIYVRAGGSPLAAADDASSLTGLLQEHDLRVGVVKGFVYADAALNAYIADPDHDETVETFRNDYQSLRALADGEVDAVLVDRITGATTVWRQGWREELVPQGLRFDVPIHLMLGIETTDLTMLERFNAAIREVRGSGEYDRIVSRYLLPVLLAQTIDRGWYRAVEMIAIIAFAISGVLLAYRGRYDIYGALVLASLPAVGGGVVRDLLAGRSPIGIATTPVYLLATVATVALGYMVLQVVPRLLHWERGQTPRTVVLLNNLLTVFDALGLAAMTVTGVVVAVATGCEPLWLWGPLLAAISGGGGGILRDVVRQDTEIPNLKGRLYPEIALVWGLAMSLYLMSQTRVLDLDLMVVAVIVTLVGAFVTRLVAAFLDIRSPVFGFSRGEAEP